MAGLRIPNTPIVVDYWAIKELPANSIFFLTHAHADHLNGLSSSWSRPIHCISITAKLIQLKRHVRQSLLVELQYDEPVIVYADGHGARVPITVTPINAYHCPGSAMFLFEGYFGTILHTGDFRLHPQLLQHELLLGKRAIDILYIDNTYCHPSCEFPTRQQAGDKVIKIVQDALLDDDEVFIGVPRVGRENLLLRVARSCHVWLSVSPDRMETLQVLQSPRVFTTEYNETRVHVVLTNQITSQQVNKWIKRHGNVTVIKPTCRHYGEGSLPFDAHPNIKLVPYSDHSSFSELKHFVQCVRPRCVKPSVSQCHMEMSYFNELLDLTAMTQYTIPQPIKTMFTCMASCDLLGKRVRKALPTLHKRRSLGVEFSDDSPLNDHYYNQSDVEKENQPHPPAANQLPPLSAELSKSPHFNDCNDCAVDQPHPSSTTAAEQPHPSFTTAAEQPHPSFTHSRYYKLIKDHISRNKDRCGSVSHDAWTLTCEFFNSRPPVTTSDWSEFNLCCINKN